MQAYLYKIGDVVKCSGYTGIIPHGEESKYVADYRILSMRYLCEPVEGAEGNVEAWASASGWEYELGSPNAYESWGWVKESAIVAAGYPSTTAKCELCGIGMYPEFGSTHAQCSHLEQMKADEFSVRDTNLATSSS